MGTRFRPNPAVVQKLGDQVVARNIVRTQPAVDRLGTECRGRPEAEVKTRLRHLLDGAGVHGLSDHTMGEYARRLAAGERVVLVRP